MQSLAGCFQPYSFIQHKRVECAGCVLAKLQTGAAASQRTGEEPEAQREPKGHHTCNQLLATGSSEGHGQRTTGGGSCRHRNHRPVVPRFQAPVLVERLLIDAPHACHPGTLVWPWSLNGSGTLRPCDSVASARPKLGQGRVSSLPLRRRGGFQDQWVWIRWVARGPGGASGLGGQPAVPIPVSPSNILQIRVSLVGEKQKCRQPLWKVGEDRPQKQSTSGQTGSVAGNHPTAPTPTGVASRGRSSPPPVSGVEEGKVDYSSLERIPAQAHESPLLVSVWCCPTKAHRSLT